MKKIVKFVFLTIFLCFIIPISFLNAQNKKLPPKDGWMLVWEDEFDGEVLDRSKWTKTHAALKKKQ